MGERVPTKYDYRDLVNNPVIFEGIEIEDAGVVENRLSTEIIFFSENFRLNTQADEGGTNIVGFEFAQKNSRMTTVWAKDVYEAVVVTDPLYQSGVIYAFGDVAGSVVGAFDPNRLQTQIDEILSGTAQLGIADSIIRHGTSDLSDGLLYADGRALSRSVYAALFAEIGIEYGPGDGSTTFNIPSQSDYPTPNEAGLVWHIKAESITPSGELVSALRFDTGWVNYDNALQDINTIITHGFNIDQSEIQALIYYMSSNGDILDVSSGFTNLNDGTVAFQDKDFGIQISSDASVIDELNQVQLRTGADGFIHLATGPTSTVTIRDDADLGSIRVILIKPNLIPTYFEPTNTVYDISDSVDVVHILPDASLNLGDRTIKRKGTGTGNVIIKNQSAAIIATLIHNEETQTYFSSSGSWELKDKTVNPSTKVLWTGPLSVVSTPTSLDGAEKFSDWDMIMIDTSLLSDVELFSPTSMTILKDRSIAQFFSDTGRFKYQKLTDTTFQIAVKTVAAGNIQRIIGISL